MMKMNAEGVPILNLKLHEGDDVIVDAKELLEWQGTLTRMLRALRRRLADPVEMVAEALYRAEPIPPGPAGLPFGSPHADWTRYRERARSILSDADLSRPLPPHGSGP